MAWFVLEAATLMKERFLILAQKVQNGLSHCIRAHLVRMVITTLIFILTAYIVLLVIPAAILSNIEGWGHGQAQYFCLVAITTIGFGDLIPTENTTGWAEWIYKLATTMYYFNGMVVLTAFASILYEKRPGPKVPSHERLFDSGTPRAHAADEQMVGDLVERELSLGHLTLEEAEGGRVDATDDDDDHDEDLGDGKYRKL